jgi:hypothetical protein
MAISRSWLCQLFAFSLLVMGIAASAHAAGWSDDFNDGSATDGNPVSWIEDLGGAGYFPGTYSAASGDYVLDPDPGPFGPISVTFVPVSFTDTYIRSQGIIMPDPLEPMNDGGNFVLLGRVNPNTLDSYLLYADSGGTLELQQAPGGGATDFPDVTSRVQLDFNAKSEIILEMNIVGNQLSGYAWQPGQSKPATPQVTATIADPVPNFAAGMAGLAFQEDEPNTFSIHRYVSAQDTPFVDALPGDYNGNGKVDAADYVMWREGLNSDPGQAGYDLWRTNFGNGGAGAGSVAAAAVPEPAGLVLMLAGILATIIVGRRRML